MIDDFLIAIFGAALIILFHHNFLGDE